MRGFSKEYKWSTNLVAWGHQRESQHFKAHLLYIILIVVQNILHVFFWLDGITFFMAHLGHINLPQHLQLLCMCHSCMIFFSVFKFLYDINYSHNLISKFYTKVLHLIQRHRTLFLGFSQRWCLVSVRTSLALTTDRWWIQLRPWETILSFIFRHLVTRNQLQINK